MYLFLNLTHSFMALFLKYICDAVVQFNSYYYQEFVRSPSSYILNCHFSCLFFFFLSCFACVCLLNYKVNRYSLCIGAEILRKLQSMYMLLLNFPKGISRLLSLIFKLYKSCLWSLDFKHCITDIHTSCFM